MNPEDIRIGDYLDVKIKRENKKHSYIIAEVLGIRQDYMNPDRVAVLLAGIDQWITVTEVVELDYADR